MALGLSITVMKEGQQVAQANVEQELLIGRSDACGLRLSDRAISREHALIRVTPEGIEVQRKSLFAPLWINGQEVTRAIAKPGDWLELGPYRMQLGAAATAAVLRDVAQSLPATPLEFEAAAGPDLGVSPSLEAAGAGRDAAGANDEIAVPSPDGAAADGEPESLEPMLDMGESPQSAPSAEPAEPLAAPQGSSEPAPPASIPNVEDTPTQGAPDPDAATRVFAADQLRAVLEFPEGAANVREIEVKDVEIVIGRGKTCQVVLTDKKSSRRHAGVSRQGSRCIVRDLGSSNGIYVNGEKVREQVLSGEDVLRIGDTEFVFKAVHVDYELQKNDFLNPDSLAEADAGLDVQPLAAAVPQLAGAMPVVGGGQAGQAAWIPGMQSAPTEEKGLQGLLGKWKALPPRKRLLYLAAAGAAIFMLLEEGETPAPVATEKPAARTTAAAPGASGDPQADAKANQEKLFEQLTPDQKKYVESQYVLAQQLFEAKDYERTYEELTKIFQLVPNYKFARDYERYSKEGIQRIKREAEDRRRREEEERVLAKVKELEADAERLAKDQQWDAMKVVLDDIQALDPENAKVAQWKSELADALERERQAKELSELQKGLNAKALEIVRAGDKLQQAERYLAAIQKYKSVDPTTPDKRIYRRALKRMADAREALTAKVQPILAEAQARESEGSAAKAYKLFRRVLDILPSSREARAGVERLRGQISERAKYVYAEAVLAESYSDFELAAKKYQECIEIAPDDNVYFQRAKRRLARYRPFTDPAATGPGGGGS